MLLCDKLDNFLIKFLIGPEQLRNLSLAETEACLQSDEDFEYYLFTNQKVAFHETKQSKLVQNKFALDYEAYQ